MKQNKTILKSYFETGDIPTQEQYEDLIDSLVHKDDRMYYIAKPLLNDLNPDQIAFTDTQFKDIQPILIIGSQNKLYVQAMRYFDCLVQIKSVSNPDNFAIYNVDTINNRTFHGFITGFDIKVNNLVSSGKMIENEEYEIQFIVTGAKSPDQSYYHYNNGYYDGGFIGEI